MNFTHDSIRIKVATSSY